MLAYPRNGLSLQCKLEDFSLYSKQRIPRSAKNDEGVARNHMAIAQNRKGWLGTAAKVRVKSGNNSLSF